MSEPKWGYLYVVKPKYKDGPFKIGIAGNLQNRLDELQTAHYEDLEVVMVLEMENPRELEKQLHRRFREYRIRGEWFAANRYLYEALLALPGIYSPIGLRTDGLRPNRSWHAAHVPTELRQLHAVDRQSRSGLQVGQEHSLGQTVPIDKHAKSALH